VQHLLDRGGTDDRAQVTREQLVDGAHHLLVALLQEPPGRVRDRAVVVADLVRRDALDVQGNPLAGDAGDRQRSSPDVERQAPYGLEAGQYRGTAADHDLEAEGLVDLFLAGVRAETGDDQRLVRLRHPPDHPEQQQEDHQRDGADDQVRPEHFPSRERWNRRLKGGDQMARAT
jgi:hypothetical protein